MNQSFVVNLKGGSYENFDGSRRQDFIEKCKAGDNLILHAEPDNPYDRHAVAVFNTQNEKLGYLPSDARDSSSILRGQKISAEVLKVVGGDAGHKFGLLIRLTKFPINWDAFIQYRMKVEKIDSAVKEALANERSGVPLNEVIDMYIKAVFDIIEINRENPVAAAHRFVKAPINKLTMLLIKQKRLADAKHIYEDWKSVLDPVGITKADQKATENRISKIDLNDNQGKCN